MEYEKFLDLLKREEDPEEEVYFLSNHNGELLNQFHQNLLDARRFSVDLIHSVNQKLCQISAQTERYDSIQLDQGLVLDRLSALAKYYEKSGQERDASRIKGMIQSLIHMENDQEDVTITKEPKLLIGEEEALHPDLLKRSFIQRILSGFVVFREIPMEEVLKVLDPKGTISSS